MAKFSQTFLQGLLQPSYQQGLFEAARGIGMTPGLMRQQKEQDRRDKGMMGGTLAAQQAAAEGRFDTETMKAYIGSMQGLGMSSEDLLKTIPTLQTANQAGVVNNSQNKLVDLQQQLKEQASILLTTDEPSRAEAASFAIDVIEDQMIDIAKNTKGINASSYIGVGDKTRAGVTQAQLQQIETTAKINGAKEKMAIASLERLQFGTEAWNTKASELEQAGFRKAVQTVRKTQQEIELANKTHADAMANFKNPTSAQIKEMEDEGVTVPEDNLGQRQAWRTYLNARRDKQIASATSYLDPVTRERAEGLVRWTMQGIAQRGDFVDVFSDDITTVIEDLTPEQHSEINSLVTGKTESQVGPIVEQWLRRNYPEPFEKSEQFRQNKERQAAAREQAIADVFSANPQLDPTNPVDVRLVNQKLDASISTERSTETGRGTSFIPTSAL